MLSPLLRAKKMGDSPQPPAQLKESILDKVGAFLGRFIAYPSEAAQIAHTLWIAHTYLMDLWDSTPRIAFLSKEPSSGKSRALEVTEILVPNPINAVNATPAYIFRKIADECGPPTLLYDEIDTVFGPRAKENEEIRGLLNAGYRKHSKTGRCRQADRNGKFSTEELPAYCAVAFAGLGHLPDTIMSRSVIIKMRRRKRGESVQKFRRRLEDDKAASLREELVIWSEGLRGEIKDAVPWPDLPASLRDRDQDIWESLILIADSVGEDWGSRARKAANMLTSCRDEYLPSIGVSLLADIRTVFTEASLSTQNLLVRLHDFEEAPWGAFRGEPMTSRQLAAELREYGIRPGTVRIGSETIKGYKRSDFVDAWARYLPVELRDAVTSVTASHNDDWVVKGVTDVTDVTGAAEPGRQKNESM